MVRADAGIVTLRQKLLLGLALCLPIPMLSLSGLALPLPSAVYRAAAALGEGAQELASVFTGARAEAEVRTPGAPAVTPRRQGRPQPASPARTGDAASASSSVRSVRLRPAVVMRQATSAAPRPVKKARRSQSPTETARTPSMPPTEGRSNGAETPATAPAPAGAPEENVTKKAQPSSIEPRPAAVGVAPLGSEPIETPATPPPPPLPSQSFSIR